MQLLAEFGTDDFRRSPTAFRSGETVPFQGRSDTFARLVAEATAGLHTFLVILDETYPSNLEEARQPEYCSALLTGFEELVWGNVIPTRHEQERLLREAGFTGDIRRTHVGEGITLLTTQRTGGVPNEGMEPTR